MRALIALVLTASLATADDSVALLPLDSSAKLEVYGQVVASEIARALTAGNIDVVVVLPKMKMPEKVKLVVDGKMTAGKGGAIELLIRVREPSSPTYLKEFPATATNLEALEKTTKELSNQTLPFIREKLDALNKPKHVDPVVTPPVVRPVTVVSVPGILVGIGTRSPGGEALRAALADGVPGWIAQHKRAPTVITPDMLDAKTAAKTVAGSGKGDRAIAFEVLSYKAWLDDGVPLGKARVRVRIADAGQVLFERVVFTDTVVGDKGLPEDRFAARIAREVMSIVQPHVKKVVPGWP